MIYRSYAVPVKVKGFGTFPTSLAPGPVMLSPQVTPPIFRPLIGVLTPRCAFATFLLAQKARLFFLFPCRHAISIRHGKQIALTTSMRALVLIDDQGHPRSTGVIRSLGRAGIDVIAIAQDPSAIGFYSRFAKKTYVVSPDSEALVKGLERIGRDGGGVLIPTGDDYLISTAKNFARLSQCFTMTMPPWERLEKLMDKPQSYDVAHAAGIPTPGFFVPHDIKEMKRYTAHLDFRNHDYILKIQQWGWGAAELGAGRRTRVAGRTATAVQERYLEIFKRTGIHPMIEEVVPGETDKCIGVSMVVNPQHTPVVCYCVKRLKLYPYSIEGEFAHPYSSGGNIYCESVHDHEAIEAATKFVRQARFYGMVTVEFRRDAIDGRLKFIKADPRPVRGISLSTALGLDLPTALYHVFTGKEVHLSKSYPERVAWLWVLQYLEVLWGNRFHAPVRKELLALLKNLRRIKAFGVLSVQDPLPFLIQLKRMGLPSRVASKLIRMLTFRSKDPAQKSL